MTPKLNITLLMPLRLFILFGLMFMLVIPMQAQESDTTAVDSIKTTALFDFHTARVEYFTGSATDNFIPIDTSLLHFHRFNPAQQNTFEMAYLGNLGAPAYHRFFAYQRQPGFDYGRHERDEYMLSLEELKYYRCNVPFTNLYYMAGGQGEQLFHVTHTRNVGKDFNFAIDFNKIISEGYFQYMKTDYTDVAATAWYTSPNQKYQVYFGGIRGKVEAQENGGIASDTVFEIIDPASVLPLRSQALTNWDNWQGQLTQHYNFGKQVSYQLTDTTTSTYFVPKYQIAHSFGLTDFYYQFQDPASERSYYGTLITNPDTLLDRTQIKTWYNRLSFGNVSFLQINKDSTAKNPVRWEVFGVQQWNEVSEATGKHPFNYCMGGFNFHAKHIIDSLFTIRLHAIYNLSDNTYSGTGALRFPKWPLNPEIFAEYRQVQPTYIQQQYEGFAYSWNNSFEPVQYMRLGARLAAAKQGFELYYTYETITNYITFYQTLFTSDIYPSAGDANISTIFLKKDVVFGNFHLHNVLGAQFTEGNINTPQLIGNLSWYYARHLFESALFFHAGVDVWYHSPYVQYDYDIITGQWINQSNFENIAAASTEPVIDVFASFDVQTLRFFIKVDNAAQGLFSKGHYIAPNYPMQPRSFHIGLNWFLFY